MVIKTYKYATKRLYSKKDIVIRHKEAVCNRNIEEKERFDDKKQALGTCSRILIRHG